MSTKFKNIKVQTLGVAIALIVLSAARCDKPQFVETFYSITVTNNSTDSICVLLADIHGPHQYPDTVLPADSPSFFVIVSGRSGYYYSDSREPWSKELEYLPADTLSMFIFDAGIYRDSSWSYIRDNHGILKRFDLSIENLEHLDFKVSYPPTLWMIDNVKMYP